MTSSSELKCDLHVHTNWSDGLLPITETIDHADLLDLEVLAITDHFPAMNKPWDAQDDLPVPESYLAAINLQKQRASDHGVQLLAGIEFHANAEPDFPLDELDLLLIEGLWGRLDEFFREIFPLMERVRKARGPDFPIILAHPHFEAPKFLPTPPLEHYFDRMERLGIILELNTSYRNYEREAIIFEEIIQTTTLRFSLGSDAHSGSKIGDIEGGWRFLERYGAENRFFLASFFGLS